MSTTSSAGTAPHDRPAITSRRVVANGLSFAVDEAGEGDAVALLLHGFPENRFSWRHQLPALAEAGWRAVAPDLRGYGDSDRPRARDAYALRHLLADTGALFDALGARRRLLIGHDWGAAIAWAFAIKQVRPLDALVTMNVPHPAVFADVLRRSWRQRARSWYIGFFQVPVVPELMLTAFGARMIGRTFTGMTANPDAFPPVVVDRYRAAALQPGAMTAMVNYYRANRAMLGRAAASPRITVPTLMLWGERDAVLGMELTRGYGPLVDDFTLRTFPQASHWVQQDAPDAVNDALTGWLGGRGLPPA